MPLTPLSRPLTPEDAAHLLRRTAFGATGAQIRQLVGREAREVARDLLAFGNETAPAIPSTRHRRSAPAPGHSWYAAPGCTNCCTAPTRCARNWP